MTAEKVDFDLLEAVARARPEWSLVLVGPPAENARGQLDRLGALDNVHALGFRPYEELPAYVAGFSVGVIPYRATAYTRNCSPLKVYEYLAAGKAVVASGVPELSGMEPDVTLADGPEAFVAAIESALAASSPEAVARRRATAEQNTWEARHRAPARPRRREAGRVAVRILVAIDQWFPDRQAGSARLAAASAAGLAARGHDVTVLAPENGSVGESTEAGVVVRRVLARNVLPQTLTDPVETWRHARELPDEAFDVLLAHESTTAFGLRGRAKQTPLVLMFHASAAREQRFLRSQLRPGLRKLSTYALAPPLGALERQAVAAADRVLVLSEFSRSLLLEDHGLDGTRIRTVPGLVDTERFAPGDGKAAARGRLGLDVDGPLLLTVRRLEPRMGIDRLLRALPLLGENDVTLVVVGSGSLAGDLPRLAAELGAAERVLFVGPVSDDARLADWYRAADLFVLPTTAYEGFGMATVEALASGTPVVGTAIGATPELLAPLDPRLIAQTADPEALAATIAEALDFATTEDFAARCRAQTEERFGLANAVAAWETALEEARR